MSAEKWIRCPVCQGKTRTVVREDTELENFPLFCPKCKRKTIISVSEFNMTVMREPVADSQADNQRE